MARCARRIFLDLIIKFELQYRGRFDESRKETAPQSTRDLFHAMKLVAETGAWAKRADCEYWLFDEVENRMSEKKLKWGILGAARVNERLLPAIIEAPNSQLVAIASRRAGAAQATLEKYAPNYKENVCLL